jgi:hypothetical protein
MGVPKTEVASGGGRSGDSQTQGTNKFSVSNVALNFYIREAQKKGRREL